VIAADKYGKLKTIFQLVALSVMHFDKLSVILYVSASVLFYISVILAVFSAVNYIITNKDVFKGGQA
jgi:CDP-diacylglycerol--glycerol-3-phosphate 3-phosphatidyltransferase